MLFRSRTRVCIAVYQWRGRQGWRTEQKPENLTWDEVLTKVEGQAPLYFAGEIAPQAGRLIRQKSKQFHLLAAAHNPRRAAFLAELAWQRVRKNQTDDPASLTPIYLRDV